MMHWANRIAGREGDSPDTHPLRPTRLAAVGGALCALCWLPWHLSVFLPLAMAVTLAAFDAARDARTALRAGALWGVLFMAVGAHFLLVLVRYSPLGAGFYLLAVLYGVPFAAAAFWAGRRLENAARLPRMTGLLLTFPLVEWLRSVGDLSLPADWTAHGLADWPDWLVLSAFGGPQLVTLWTLGCGLLVLLAWRARQRAGRALILGALALGAWLLPPAVGMLTNDGAGAEGAVRVGLVQPAITVEDKHQRSRQNAVWQRLRRLSQRAAQDADLIVWPESARPSPLIFEDGTEPKDPVVQELARELGTPILYGTEVAIERDGALYKLYNGIALARPETEAIEWYGKQQLLPLAEGLPFADLLGLDPAERLSKQKGQRSMVTMLGPFSSGDGPVVFEVAGLRIGALVCYESLYPALSRAYSAAGADTLAVLTNDAWWGRSAFAWRHAGLAAARARETSMPVIRAANDGVSMLIDARGHVLANTRLDETTTLTVPVPRRPRHTTPYVRLGNWPVYLLLVLLAGTTVRAVLLRRSGRASNAMIDRKPAS